MAAAIGRRLLLAAGLSVPCLLAAQLLRMRRAIASLRAQLARAHELRLQERAGRTAAERKARQPAVQGGQSELFRYRAIGRIESCFSERRGTPRQGMLAPAARSSLTIDRGVINPSSLEGLELFSHVWLLYDFHENTNSNKLHSPQLRAKIHPPALGGEKIGLFATRTPHRPSPIGLTVARLHGVRGDTLELGGADLIDGTPVLDVKPCEHRWAACKRPLSCLPDSAHASQQSATPHLHPLPLPFWAALCFLPWANFAESSFVIHSSLQFLIRK